MEWGRYKFPWGRDHAVVVGVVLVVAFSPSRTDRGTGGQPSAWAQSVTFSYGKIQGAQLLSGRWHSDAQLGHLRCGKGAGQLEGVVINVLVAVILCSSRQYDRSRWQAFIRGQVTWSRGPVVPGMTTTESPIVKNRDSLNCCPGRWNCPLVGLILSGGVSRGQSKFLQVRKCIHVNCKDSVQWLKLVCQMDNNY